MTLSFELTLKILRKQNKVFARFVYKTGIKPVFQINDERTWHEVFVIDFANIIKNDYIIFVRFF